MGEIDLDPASCAMAQETVRAKQYYTAEDDGLTKEWSGNLWVNPPYSAGLIDKFAAKLVREYEAGNVREAIVLVDNRTDTGWFYGMAVACERICFTRGRINFYNEKTASSSPANGSALLYFGDDPDTFEEVFAQFGWVVPSPSAARRARASPSSPTHTDKFVGAAE
jgi:ParB family chromosome partitioning protein